MILHFGFNRSHGEAPVLCIGKSSIGHAVGLLGANDKFLIKSGLSRLRFLARSDEYALCIIENGGTSKLISLLQKNTEKGKKTSHAASDDNPN